MKSERRSMHGKRRRRSPIKKDYDFSNVPDYSPKATKGNFGDKLASAITPENTTAGIVSAVGGGGILRNAPKILKAAKSYFSS